MITELAKDTRLNFFSRLHPANILAVGTAVLLAFAQKGGKGALILWPLFGTVNQLLAALALLVITLYLYRRKANVFYVFLPFLFMVSMTGWAMVYNIEKFLSQHLWHLFIIGIFIFLLEVWMIVESLKVMGRRE